MADVVEGDAVVNASVRTIRVRAAVARRDRLVQDNVLRFLSEVYKRYGTVADANSHIVADLQARMLVKPPNAIVAVVAEDCDERAGVGDCIRIFAARD